MATEDPLPIEVKEERILNVVKEDPMEENVVITVLLTDEAIMDVGAMGIIKAIAKSVITENAGVSEKTKEVTQNAGNVEVSERIEETQNVEVLEAEIEIADLNHLVTVQEEISDLRDKVDSQKIHINLVNLQKKALIK